MDAQAAPSAETIARLAEHSITDREQRIAELEGQLERAVDLAIASAVRVTELEAKMVELTAALERRNGQLADATEAAESWRSELVELKRVLRKIGDLADVGD